MPDNSPAKAAPKPVPAAKPAVPPAAKPGGIQAVTTANKTPVPSQLAAKPEPLHSVPQLRRQALRLSTKIFFGVFGVAGGIGKSLGTDVIADLYRAAGVTVEVIRMEAEVRREEFPGDAFVGLDSITDVQEQVGGVAGLFEDAFDLTQATFANNGNVVLDGGANSHGPFVTLATETGLSQLIADQGGRSILVIVLTRDADQIRQTVRLIANLRACAPEAEIVIVLNERDGKFANDGATAEGRAYRELLVPLMRVHKHVTMPLAGARTLAAFAGCGHSFSEIFEANMGELMQWSGLKQMRARSCQTHLSAFYYEFAQQLVQVLPFRDEA